VLGVGGLQRGLHGAPVHRPRLVGPRLPATRSRLSSSSVPCSTSSSRSTRTTMLSGDPPLTIARGADKRFRDGSQAHFPGLAHALPEAAACGADFRLQKSRRNLADREAPRVPRQCPLRRVNTRRPGRTRHSAPCRIFAEPMRGIWMLVSAQIILFGGPFGRCPWGDQQAAGVMQLSDGPGVGAGPGDGPGAAGGPAALVHEHVRIGHRCGVNAGPEGSLPGCWDDRGCGQHR
jgi:hypothetical protein